MEHPEKDEASGSQGGPLLPPPTGLVPRDDVGAEAAMLASGDDVTVVPGPEAAAEPGLPAAMDAAAVREPTPGPQALDDAPAGQEAASRDDRPNAATAEPAAAPNIDAGEDETVIARPQVTPAPAVGEPALDLADETHIDAVLPGLDDSTGQTRTPETQVGPVFAPPTPTAWAADAASRLVLSGRPLVFALLGAALLGGLVGRLLFAPAAEVIIKTLPAPPPPQLAPLDTPAPPAAAPALPGVRRQERGDRRAARP